MLNIAAVTEAIAAQFPDREAMVWRDQRWTFAELIDRSQRLANFLLSKGLTIYADRSELKNWEVGQHRVAIYMHNSPQYLEALLGGFMARAIPFNVNYRYVGEELVYLFGDAEPKAVIYEAQFAPTLAKILPQVKSLEYLIQVDDGSGEPLLPGSLDYEQLLSASPATPPDVDLSPDDIYCMYTGGTTGMPKGVLWRQADSLYANLTGRYPDGKALPDAQAFVERAKKSGGKRVLAAPPFMHGAGTQVALAGWVSGNTVVIQSNVSRMDAADLLSTIERERVSMPMFIGDAYGRPMVEEAKSGKYDLSSVKLIYNSGATLSADIKQALLELMPGARLVDALGSSETGPQAMNVSTRDSEEIVEAKFTISEDSSVLNEDRTSMLAEGHEGFGWLAKRGQVPLGYLGDPTKTNETFPVVDGVRYVVGGDRVRLKVGGEVEFHGRESFTINSGGEKIFAEEVERAIKHHPQVADVVVTSRPSERWGNEVVAIVQWTDGNAGSREDLLEEAAKHIARYKLPKAFLFLDQIHRGPSGKTDNRWAQSVAGDAS